MPHFSIRISDHLNQELGLKAQKLNTDKSVLARDFIRQGLANFQTNKDPYLEVAALLKRNINYTILSHCLMEMVVSDYVDNGAELCTKANSKAETLMNHLLQKFSNSFPESIDFVKFKAEFETDN